MTPKEHPTTDIKVFIVIGAVAVLLIATLPLLGLQYILKETARKTTCQGRSANDPGCAPSQVWGFLDDVQKGMQAAQPTTNPTPPVVTQSAGLGEEGSACGGPARLPCKPGLECSKSAGQDIGVCVKAVAERYTADQSQIGASCGKLNVDCISDLVCRLKTGTDSGTCAASDTTSPKALSIQLSGAQFDQGWYMATPGTKVDVAIQAINAESGELDRLDTTNDPNDPRDGITRLGPIVRGQAGKFTGTFVFTRGLHGKLLVRLFSKDGQVSVMGVNVSSTN